MAAIRIGNGAFETWRALYGGAVVTVYLPGTTTKASLFLDEALTIAAANPQTLQRYTQNGVNYGKLLAPVYVGVSHTIDVDGAEQTGVIRPTLVDLVAADASYATAIANGGTIARTLRDMFQDVFNAENYGQIGPAQSSATNTATLTAAIAAAVGVGGGMVFVPEGALPFTSFSIPAGVIVAGRGQNGNVTVLQSQTGANCITFSGAGAGLANVVLDGVNKVASSVGIFARAAVDVTLLDVLVKNFETGIFIQGGSRCFWTDAYVSGCSTGVKWHGDLNASGGSNGSELRNMHWLRGRVSDCTVRGVEIKYIDKKAWVNCIEQVGFESNGGIGLYIEGARYLKFPRCWWTGNTTNLSIVDGTPTTSSDVNTVVDVHFDGGSMSGGAVALQGALQDVILDKMELSDVDFTLTLPQNNVVVRDCIEDSNVTIAGDGTRFSRCRTMLGDAPSTSGVSTSATPVVAWAYKMAAGEVIFVEFSIVAIGRNTVDWFGVQSTALYRRPGAALAYVLQTANFTAGDIVTGATSGAKARIMADSDSGASGTLTVKSITKEFLAGEIITGALGGSATVSGTLTYSAAVLVAQVTSTPVQRSDAAMSWNAVIAAEEAQMTVIGVAAKTTEWTVAARVTSTG